MSTEVDDRPAHLRLTVGDPFTLLPVAVNVAVVVLVGDVGALIATVICLDPTRPPESVTLAVMTCVPLDSVLEKDPPVPIWPSMLDTQTSFDVRLPSWVSLAEPEKETVAPYAYDELLAGVLIVTAGAVLVTACVCPDATFE
jgi:hypothetical protein